MTSPTYTLAQLQALPERELDAVVAEVVMGYVWRRCDGFDFPLLYRPEVEVERDDWAFFDLAREPHPDVPRYSTKWGGLGLTVLRMRDLGFCLEVSSFCSVGPGAVSFSKDHRYEWVHGDDLPRATAIAAVLAVQGVG